MDIIAPLHVTEKEIKENKVKIYNLFLNIREFTKCCALFCVGKQVVQKEMRSVSLYGEVWYPVGE